MRPTIGTFAITSVLAAGAGLGLIAQQRANPGAGAASTVTVYKSPT